MTKNKKIAWWCVLGPVLLMVLDFIIYAGVGFLKAQGSLAQDSSSLVIINLVAGLVMLISVIGLIIGIVLAVFYSNKKEAVDFSTELEQQKYIDSWSWAGFFGSFVYAFGNRLKNWGLGLIFLCIVEMIFFILPYLDKNLAASLAMSKSMFSLIGLVAAIYLGIKGRKLAWQKGAWSSFAEFQVRQQKIIKYIWLYLILMFIVGIIIGGVAVYSQFGAVLKGADKMSLEEEAKVMVSYIEAQGRTVEDKEIFKTAYIIGRTEGGLLKATSTVPVVVKVDYVAGYASGYAVGCSKLKPPIPDCEKRAKAAMTELLNKLIKQELVK
ncbi:MAG: hypothetical protein WCW02_00405 [Candidatus Buchananbacteria bacterium]